MKKKIKILTFFSLAFLLFMTSCEKDLYDDAISSSKIKISKVSIKDPLVFNNKLLMNEIHKLKNKQQLYSQAESRIVYDSINDFYFDDENGIKIDKDNYESYTFEVIRPNSNNKIENILLIKEISCTYFNTYLIKYDFTKEEFETLTIQELNEKSHIITNYNTDTVNSFSAEDPCDEWIEVSQSPRYFKVMYDPCAESGNGGTGGDSSGGGMDTGGTGTTGQNTNNGVILITSPIAGGLSNTLANPCKKVKDQTNKYQGLKQSLIDLATTTSQSQENGFYVDNTATSTTPNPFNNLSSSAGGSIEVPYLPSPKKYSVLAHTHDASGSNGAGTFSIFSFGDLQKIAELITLNQIDESFVYFVSTADGTNYAMTIDWPSKFAEYFDERKDKTIPLSITNRDYNKAIMLDKMEKNYYKNEPAVGKITRTSNPTDDKKIFLKMMKELNLDISIFEVTDNFSTFSKLQLKNGIVTATPCN